MTMSDFPGRALIIDDHPLYSDALSVGLASLNANCQVEIATSVTQARRVLERESHFDLVMLDLILQEATGLSMLGELREHLPHARIVVISSREESGVVSSALAMGADGFIGKSTTMPEIVEALRRIALGLPHAGSKLGAPPAAPETDRIAGLSPAQMRILVALADGRLNKQIAFDLGLAEPTVKSHLSAIFKKLGVTNRTQAILVARAMLPAPAQTTELA